MRVDGASVGSSCAGVTAKDGPAGHHEVTQARTHEGTIQSCRLKVRSWWQTVYGETLGFSVKYVFDNSLPWSANAFETVFRLDDSQESRKVLSLVPERNEIVSEIATYFQKVRPQNLTEQPFVHIRGEEIHVRFQSSVFLKALWKTPPSYKGQPMKLVSKGLGKGGTRVYKAYLPSETKADLEKRLEGKTFPGVEFILADIYEVENLGGGPIFRGDFVLVCSAAVSAILGEKCFEILYPRRRP